MDFNYESSGEIRILGGSNYCLSHIVSIKFSVGDFLYLKHKAKEGIFERICVKKVVLKPYKNHAYISTLNRIHFENNLVSHEEAIELVKSHLENLIAGFY